MCFVESCALVWPGLLQEETLINVELTRLQKAYYRAIFERNRTFLMRGVTSSTAANLVNVEMELRKCCNHPFLLRGAEQREAGAGTTRAERIEAMVAASGKMVLLDKLLPKLQSEDHRVLIFSQFKTMLSLLEELLQVSGAGMRAAASTLQWRASRVVARRSFRVCDPAQARGYKYERLDGSIRGNERQAAIDRFNKPGR